MPKKRPNILTQEKIHKQALPGLVKARAHQSSKRKGKALSDNGKTAGIQDHEQNVSPEDLANRFGKGKGSRKKARTEKEEQPDSNKRKAKEAFNSSREAGKTCKI